MSIARRLFRIISGLVFAAVLAVTADLAASFFSLSLPTIAFALIFLITAVLLLVFPMLTDKLWFLWLCVVLVAAILLAVLLFSFHSQSNDIVPPPVNEGNGTQFIELQNLQGDLVYNYYLDEKGSEQFLIHAKGIDGEFVVSCSNARCAVSYGSGIITVKCPKEESCIVTVANEDGSCSYSAYISNPGRFMRETGPQLEKLTQSFLTENLQQSNSYKVFNRIF